MPACSVKEDIGMQTSPMSSMETGAMDVQMTTVCSPCQITETIRTLAAPVPLSN